MTEPATVGLVPAAPTTATAVADGSGIGFFGITIPSCDSVRLESIAMAPAASALPLMNAVELTRR